MLCFRNYERSELERMSVVRKAYRILGEKIDSGHYETHHPFVGDNCVYQANFSTKHNPSVSYDLSIMTAGFIYSTILMKKARALTLERFPDYLDHSWSADDKGKPLLNFHSSCRKEAGDFFMCQLRELAADQAFSVTESCSIITDGVPRTLVNLIINRAEVSEALVKETMDHFERHETLAISTLPLRFPFETIERHISALDHKMIELLNGRDSILPLSNLDMQLLEAAGHLDLKKASNLVRAGANINCIGDNGETPLASFIAASIMYLISPGEQGRRIGTDLPHYSEALRSKCEEECLTDCKELLKMGANPNIFGFNGNGALQEAVFQAFPRIVELLLQHGANPNYNPFADDEPWVISQPLETASADMIVYESDEDKKRFEQIVLLLKRHGARISKDDNGEIYPPLPPYQPDEQEIALGKKSADARVFYLACQLAAGINRHEPGIFAPFLTDDVLYENTASGVQKKGLLTVMRHFDEAIAAIQADYMENHLLIEIAICKASNEAVLIMHGTRKQFPVGIGGPVGQLRIVIDSEGMIQKIISEDASSADQIVSEYLFPGFAAAEFQELQKNLTGRIPPTQDVLINVNGSMGITLPDMQNAAKILKDEYPCIRIQEIHSEDREKIRFFKIHSMPSLDIFYKGRLMRRFNWSSTVAEIIEGGRQLFESGFFAYTGQEGHGDRWGTLGEVEATVAKLIPKIISEGSLGAKELVNRDWDEMTPPAAREVCSILYAPQVLGFKAILCERGTEEKAFEVITAFPAVRKGIEIAVTIQEILPWEDLMEGVIVGQLDGEDGQETFGQGATIGFFDTDFSRNYWRYRAGERLMFNLAGLVINFEKVENLTFAITDQDSLKRKYNMLGEEPELDSDGRIKPDIYNMDGMKALMSGSDKYPEDCSFHMKINRMEVFELEGIPVFEVFGPLFPTGPVEEGVLYIPGPVLPEDTLLRVGDNIRGIAWFHGFLTHCET